MLERLRPAGFLQAAAVFRAGDAVWELSEPELAATYRGLALRLIDAGIGDPPVGSISLTVARMASLIGDHGEAADWFARARVELGAAGALPMQAIADYDEALALTRSESGDRARIAELAQAALAAFGALGMNGWEQRAVRLIPGPARPLPDRLTAREGEVLRLLAAGRTNKEIAAELFLSPATVERHVANLYRKIGVRRRTEATAYALSHGLLESPVG